MENFEKIESLLKSKSYDELSREERVIVERELSKETYEELRVSIMGIRGEKLKVSKDTKQSLLNEMKPKSSFSPFALLQVRVPAYALLIPLLFFFFILLREPNEVRIPEARIVEVMLHDTIRIQQIDTLVVERVIRVPQMIYITENTNVAETTSAKKEVERTTLSDQTEILDLVIRGE
ncbi:hypothetical protein [Ekhidna sp.]|uniref:hypothetical protein n=1 Tax=Ekhidna sp. TaxID=2608089 RepID=UPI003C7A056D